MPVVFTINNITESGHDYDDLFGAYYSYPLQYQRLVKPGTHILFYSGRRTSSKYPYARYIGSGIVGEIREISGRDNGRDLLQCETVNVVEFPVPVPHRSEEHGYLESGANHVEHVGLFYRRGVRQISIEDFKKVLRMAVNLNPLDEKYPPAYRVFGRNRAN